MKLANCGMKLRLHVEKIDSDLLRSMFCPASLWIMRFRKKVQVQTRLSTIFKFRTILHYRPIKSEEWSLVGRC